MTSVHRTGLCYGATVILFSVLLFQTTNGANILGVFTSSSVSHVIVQMSMMKVLAEKGHNVTVVTTMKPTVTDERIHHIIIPLGEEYDKAFDDMVKKMSSKNVSLFYSLLMILSRNIMIQAQADVLKNPKFQKLYEEPGTKFDVLFVGYFMNDFQLGLSVKFKCPVIVSWVRASGELTDVLIGNPREVSYVSALSADGGRMDFFDRVKNMLASLGFRGFHFLLNMKIKGYYEELYANDPTMPSYEETRRRVSLVFANSHFSEGRIRPNVPALIEIGGIQAKDKPNPLPEDIAKFLDSAKKDGAILFSLGSNIKSSGVASEVTKNVFKVLSSLKQKVIWKWENLEKTPGKSANILYKKWLPQDDILAHPNIKLFITHAGKGGVAEAQFHGVPMVALPFMADQHTNAEKMVKEGFGLQLNMLSLTEADFKKAILEVLNEPKYAERAKGFTKLYLDRPMTAKESVVYWTEYVIRHRGAMHMQSPLVHLNYFQAESWDVIAFLLLACYIIFKIIQILIKFITRIIVNQFKGKKSKKIKKN